MNKDLFISICSKISETFEDEFKAEFNSPELIWDKIVRKLTATSPVICTCHQDNILFSGGVCSCDRCGVEINFRDIIHFSGKGEHSINELESIIWQQEEEIYKLKIKLQLYEQQQSRR